MGDGTIPSCKSTVASRTKWRGITLSLRVAPIVLMLAHFIGLVNCDVALATFYSWLLERSWFQMAMVEAVVAASSFFLWIVVFRTLDSIEVIKQFRFVERPAEVGLPVPIQDITEGLCNLKADRPRTARQRKALRIFSSFPVYLGGIALLHAVRDPRPIPLESPTFLRVVGELVFGIWAYDFVFYWLHLAMHRFPHRLHGHSVHHELAGSKYMKDLCFMEADTVVHHSLVDGMCQVAVNIFVQNLQFMGSPKHKLSRLLHNVVVTYLLTEAHSGLDLPWGSHRVLPWLLGGAPRHECHHTTHKHCFHQFFKYLDDFFGYGPPAGWE